MRSKPQSNVSEEHDVEWPNRESEWTQQTLHAYVRQMGINPDPLEIVPQGVKYIAWPQPPLSEEDIAMGRQMIREFRAGRLKPIAVIKRKRDPRRN